MLQRFEQYFFNSLTAKRLKIWQFSSNGSFLYRGNVMARKIRHVLNQVNCCQFSCKEWNLTTLCKAGSRSFKCK